MWKWYEGQIVECISANGPPNWKFYLELHGNGDDTGMIGKQFMIKRIKFHLQDIFFVLDEFDDRDDPDYLGFWSGDFRPIDNIKLEKLEMETA